MQYQQYPTPTPAQKKSFPWVPVLIGVVTLCLFCGGIVLVVVVGRNILGEKDIFRRTTPTIEVPTEMAEAPPVATEAPLPSPTEDLSPAETATQITIEQAAAQTAEIAPTETAQPQPTATATPFESGEVFFDAFSEVNPDWNLLSDEIGTAEIRDGALYIALHKANYEQDVLIPVDFPAAQVSFNATNLQDPFDGTFGVICNYQDDDNYFYVELTMPEGYIMGYWQDGDPTILTGTEINSWTDASGLRTNKGDMNHFDVVCATDAIALFINGNQVVSTPYPVSFGDAGQVGLFAYAVKGMDKDGFEVKFDDLQVYEFPVLKPEW